MSSSGSSEGPKRTPRRLRLPPTGSGGGGSNVRETLLQRGIWCYFIPCSVAIPYTCLNSQTINYLVS